MQPRRRFEEYVHRPVERGRVRYARMDSLRFSPPSFSLRGVLMRHTAVAGLCGNATFHEFYATECMLWREERGVLVGFASLRPRWISRLEHDG